MKLRTAMDVEKQIAELRIVPVAQIENLADAIPLGRALIDGGLPVLEITFRTDAAYDAIKVLARELPELLLGAGTVLTIDNVNQAIDAGAAFLVAPGFNPRIVDYCIDRSIPIFPGVNSPSQVELGLERNLHVLKFFPAEISGGVAMIQAMSAPYGNVRFMPTGGIRADNIGRYLELPAVIACGGSWMVKPALIAGGQFHQISRLAAEAVVTAAKP